MKLVKQSRPLGDHKRKIGQNETTYDTRTRFHAVLIAKNTYQLYGTLRPSHLLIYTESTWVIR